MPFLTISVELAWFLKHPAKKNYIILIKKCYIYEGLRGKTMIYFGRKFVREKIDLVVRDLTFQMAM